MIDPVTGLGPAVIKAELRYGPKAKPEHNPVPSDTPVRDFIGGAITVGVLFAPMAALIWLVG